MIKDDDNWLTKALKSLFGWLGFIALIVTGVVLIIMGITRPDHPRHYFIFGIGLPVIALVSWIDGGRAAISKVSASAGTGQKFSAAVLVDITDLTVVGVLADIALMALMFVLAYFVH